MRRLRNVKIVATLGPASETREVIEALHRAGADVFRLNMSHGSHEEIREKHRIIREVEKEAGGENGILHDPQGPDPGSYTPLTTPPNTVAEEPT